ncbi:MAG TPA: FAD-dependent oxidoreductase [Polyangia bacterium]|nr:FAD-dependent oxidoreductase [Polyangia bacterium]
MDIYGNFDVIVCGGGTSGVPAAIASARTGAKTILIERLGALGGQMTVSGPPGFAYAHMFNDRGEQIINGFLGETHDRLLQAEHALPYPPQDQRTATSYAFIDPEWWSFMVYEMMQENKVHLLLHSLVVDVLKEGDTVKGVVVENTEGRQTILGKVVIDCTGEGDIASRAGAPFEHVDKDDPFPLEPPSIAFTMDGIDWDEVLAYAKEHAEELAVVSPAIHVPEEVVKKNAQRIRNMKSGRELISLGSLSFSAISRELIDKGEYHPYGDLGFFFTPREGGVIQAIFQHSAQVANCDCVNIDELTYGEVEARRQAVITIKAARKYLPGFQNAYVTRTTLELRVRETRRILCDYQLNWEDANAGKKFPDVIGKSAMTMGSRHVATVDTLGMYACGRADPPDGGSFDLPYRILVPKDVENLLVAGKMVSATRECALRFLPETTETGQAAGVAAAISVRSGRTPRKLEDDLSEVQKTLEDQGVILFGTR